MDLRSVAAVLLADVVGLPKDAGPDEDAGPHEDAGPPGWRDLSAVLARLNLPWTVLRPATGGELPAARPDPAAYRRAAAELGVDPARCLVVAETAAGVAAGRAAGMPAAALRGLAGDLRPRDLTHLAHLLTRSRTEPWWRDAIGYQVYLPSFADSDGDGWGDLAGVTAHLDYLVDLGVDLIWLTPFFVSPMVDHGYDIADYRTVDPRFGGDAELAELLAAADARGLPVIGDLVVNHTSEAHPWFAAAASGRDNPYRDYYLWRDPAPDGGPPNNWFSHFGGPAWTLSPATGQYYLHLFRPEQPDLNWRNPAVIAEVDAVMDYWAGRGLAGFRIDTAAYLLKHPDLLDNPPMASGVISQVSGATLDWRGQDHRYDIHQPDVHAIHEHWRTVADRNGTFLLGEVWELDAAALAAFVTEERLHSSYWFGLVESDWDAERLQTMLAAAATASPRLAWVQGNHDRSRAATRYGGGDAEVGRRRSLALHALMAVLPGTTWLYQGEELGLIDGVVPPEQAADPLAEVAPEQSRDGARTPMPWMPEPGLGFTTGRPWLPEGERKPTDTVAVQAADPGSHLAAIRRLLHTRRWAGLHAVHTDDELVVERLPSTEVRAGRASVTCYRRGRVWVLANLADADSGPVELPAPAVYDTDDPDVGPERPRRGTVRLAPQQALLLVGPS